MKILLGIPKFREYDLATWYYGKIEFYLRRIFYREKILFPTVVEISEIRNVTQKNIFNKILLFSNTFPVVDIWKIYVILTQFISTSLKKISKSVAKMSKKGLSSIGERNIRLSLPKYSHLLFGKIFIFL